MPTITVNDVELYYEERDTGTEPILFAHGFLLSSKMWQDLYVARLPEHYHAYAIDMRGHGRSHHIKHGCNLVQLADDVYQFVRQLRLGKVSYVGVSMGAAVGVQLALTHPEILKALVLMNPGIGSHVTTIQRLMRPVVSLIIGRRWPLKMFINSMSKRALPEAWLQAFLDDAVLVTKETWLEYGHPSNLIQSLDRLAHLDVPTLVMIGEKDNVLPLDVQHQIADTIPHAKKIVFEGEGHGIVGEIPGRVFQAMHSFLEEVK
jgi:branched-chain amino acid transport system permease protein